MKFTTLISSTTPFINLLVALLLHNPSSSIVAANEDAFSFSTAASSTTDNNAVESVIDLNPRRSLGKGSDKKVLPEELAEKMKEYLDEDLLKPYQVLDPETGEVIATLTDVRSFVEYILALNEIVSITKTDGIITDVRGALPASLVAQYDVFLPDEFIHETCGDDVFGFGDENTFTEDICDARDKVVAMCAKEPTCNDETFDETFLIRAAKSSYLNEATIGKLYCVEVFMLYTYPEATAIENCSKYEYLPGRTSEATVSSQVFIAVDAKMKELFTAVNDCLPEGFNNPLLNAGPVYRSRVSARDGNQPVFRIIIGWLSMNKQVTDEINNDTYWNLLIMSKVMRFFAINWIDEQEKGGGRIDCEDDVPLRRKFENEVMASYFMEKHSKDILTRKEKKHLFGFTDFEQFIDCASHLGAKLANEECDTEAAFEKVQDIAKDVPDSQEAIDDGSASICENYTIGQRENWREYAKKVMDKTMTSKCGKKAGGKSSKSEKKSVKRLRKD